MISAVTGELLDVSDDRIQLAMLGGGIVLEVLVPAADVDRLRSAVGSPLTFHTLLYFEGDSSGGNSEPRLLGFTTLDDKRFFEKFITVKGIGPRKALRALVHPASELADAIEARDPRRLSSLPGIGKRTAEQIIAELSGKVAEFVKLPARLGGAKSPAFHGTARTPAEEDAILSLMALGERRPDAEQLLERARAQAAGGADIASTDALVRTMLRLRGAR